MTETMRTIKVPALVCCAVAALIAACLCIAPASADARSLSEIQAEADAATAQINALQEEMIGLEAQYTVAYDELMAATEAMNQAQAAIEETEKKIADLQTRLGTRAATMYRNGNGSFVDIILGSKSFDDLVNNWEMLNKLNENDAAMVQESKTLKEELEKQKAEYQKQKIIAEEKTAEVEEALNATNAKIQEQVAIYNSLSAEASAIIAQQQAAAAAAAQQQVEVAYVDSNGVAHAADGSIIDRAKYYVGNSTYTYGASSDGNFDCSGFVTYCLTGQYGHIGGSAQMNNWPTTNNPQVGDVCVVYNPSAGRTHVGIYAGNGMMYDSIPGQGVGLREVWGDMKYVTYGG